MYLIIFFILFGLVGYWLAASRFSRPIERTTSALTEKPRSWLAKFRARGKRDLTPTTPSHPFVIWATGDGARYLPDDFRTWLASLSPQEAGDFAHFLEDYAQGLGFRLDDLAGESLQAKPALMQVYVEALTIYSQAYRKAKQAQKAAEKAEDKPSSAPDGHKTNGKQDGKASREAASASETALLPAS